MAYETEDGNVVCEQCGNEYTRVGTHWARSQSCDYPELTRLQKDILVGSLMGDGNIDKKNKKNQPMKVDWSSEDQCKWLDDNLGWMSTGVSLVETSEGACARMGGSDMKGYERSTDPDDWSDIYRVRTRSHPFITKMTTEWYGDSGYEKKCWPDDLVLSPTVLLLWYVGDGYYNNKQQNRDVRIFLSNEEGNEDKIDQYCQQAGIPEPSRWEKSGSYGACWNVSESKSLFEYMDQSPLMDDGPPDGFAYKFPEEYGGTGKSMADVEPAETPQTALTAD